MTSEDKPKPITKTDRHTAITDYINSRGFVEVAELATFFDVTAETIRTDLVAVAESGRIQRVRGGARPTPADDVVAEGWKPRDLMLSERAELFTELKRSIAATAALELPEEEDGYVILDAGSSVSQLAATFPTGRAMHVMTNSVEIASELARNDRLDVTVTGGQTRAGSLAVVGGLAATQINRFHANVAFISSDAASIARGLLTVDSEEAELKRCMIGAADRVVALLDHTKFEDSRGARIKAATWAEIDLVITDTGAPPALIEALQKVVPEVRVAPPRRVVGVDVGGRGIRAGIIDTTTGKLIGNRLRRPTPQPSTVEAVVEVVTAMVGELQWLGPVGVAMPGQIKNGRVGTKTYLDDSWYRTDAVAVFSDALQRPVTVINDGDAAGRAEADFGAGAGVVDGVVIMLVVGTGVGSFMMEDGRAIPNTEFGQTALSVGNAQNLTRRKQLDELGIETWSAHFNELMAVLAKKHKPTRIIVGGGISKNYEAISHNLIAPHGVELVVAKARNLAEMIGAAHWRSAQDRTLVEETIDEP